VRLTTDELRELPLSAKWCREDGSDIASTPEWVSGGAGSTQFRFGSLRLIVAEPEQQPGVAALSARVLEELDRCAASAPPDLRAVRNLLRAGLRLVTGVPDLTERRTSVVMEAVRAAAREENVDLRTREPVSGRVRGGDTVALAVKQLATNARRHDQAEDMRLEERTAGDFRVSWRGTRTPGPVDTSRHPDQRRSWGLGLARLAADALGAALLPVRHRDDGRSESAFALLSGGRFTLPLAAVDAQDRVVRATRAWDEETALSPGHALTAELSSLADEARRVGAAFVHRGAFAARRGAVLTWIVLTPRGTREQARDLVAGVVHERALAGDGADAVRLEGCAQALGLALGAPTKPWLSDAVAEELPAACSAFDAPMPLIEDAGGPIPPAPLLAFLSAQGRGGQLQACEGGWTFRPLTSTALLAALGVRGTVVIR
jgi:hypothetical protein